MATQLAMIMSMTAAPALPGDTAPGATPTRRTATPRQTAISVRTALPGRQCQRATTQMVAAMPTHAHIKIDAKLGTTALVAIGTLALLASTAQALVFPQVIATETAGLDIGARRDQLAALRTSASTARALLAHVMDH